MSPRAPSPRTAVAYVRVSTDDQQLGPSAQRRAIELWAGREKIEIVGWFVDAGVSGAADLGDRPGLQSALAVVESGAAGLLVVAKRDRLARDTMQAAVLERLVARAGGRIVSADGVGNGDGPEAGLMRTIIDAFAAYERELIRARTRAALAVKRGRGEYVGGGVPYGYALGADGETLVPNPGEQSVIEAARGYRAAGLSLRAIAARLYADGFRTRAGGRFAPQSVANMV